MLSTLPFLLLSALLTPTAFAKDEPSSDASVSIEDVKTEVSILTTDTFDKWIGSHENALVKFFAPWCGHCKTLTPEFHAASVTLKTDNIHLGTVNCVENEELCSRHGVQGYPTLKVFRQGKSSAYEGPRLFDGIVKYMRAQTKPLLSKLISSVELKEFKAALEKSTEERKKDSSVLDDVIVVAALSDKDKEAKVFEDALKAVAEVMRIEIAFAYIDPKASDSAEMRKSLGMKASGNAMTLLKNFDELRIQYTGSFDEKEITKFLAIGSTPFLVDVGPENFTKFMSNNLPIVYGFYNGEEERSSLLTSLQKTLTPIKGTVNGVMVNSTMYGGHAFDLGIKMELDSEGKPKSLTTPLLIVHQMERNERFSPAEQGSALTSTAIEAFMTLYKSGKAPMIFRGAEPPATNDGPVKEVVFKTFESIVLDSKRDVLVEIYKSDCPACKYIAPIYEDLAKLYQDQKDKITIAKIDGIANELPPSITFELQRFPTILLFKAGSKVPVEFEPITPHLKDYIEFIVKNNSKKLNAVVAPEEKEPSAPGAEGSSSEDAAVVDEEEREL